MTKARDHSGQSSLAPSRQWRCPYCDVLNQPARDECWLCESPRDESTVRSVGREPAANSKPAVPFSFSVSSLLLLMTLVAIVAGIASVARGLAIVIAVMLAPIGVVLASQSREARGRGERISTAEKAAFIGSMLVAGSLGAVVAVLSAFGGFLALCIGPVVLASNPKLIQLVDTVLEVLFYAAIAAGVVLGAILLFDSGRDWHRSRK